MQLGTKVKMSKAGKARWHESSTNPHDLKGVVIPNQRAGSTWIRVEWSNGQKNSYQDGDLKAIVKKEKVDKSALLAEVLYTDNCGDTMEVDTMMRSGVYVSVGTIVDGSFETGGDGSSCVELEAADVIKLRKQLKAWLDKHQPSV